MSEKVVMARFERIGAVQAARKRFRGRCGGMLLAVMIAMLPIQGSLVSHAAIADGMSDSLVTRAAVADGISDSLVSQECIAAATGTSISFSDVAEKAWYASDLRFITNDSRKILEGMPDGRFHPSEKLSVEQFLKCVVVAANQRPSPQSGYWAQPYIDKALEMGIVGKSQFISFREGISRGDMAQIIASAFTLMTGESVPAVDASAVSKRMKDYATIPVHQQKAVCLAYSVGILTGMPDGKFHPEGILSRAEAVAVIRRVIDPSARIQVGDDPADAADDVDSDATSGVSSEVWSDEEFQAFMASDEWKNYLNPNTIAGMEDGVLLFYEMIPIEELDFSKGTTQNDRYPILLPEPYYSRYYELAKIMSYYAKKLNGKATVAKTTSLGGQVSFDMSDIGGWLGYAPDPCFKVSIHNVMDFSPDFPQYFPGQTAEGLNLVWEIDSFYSVPDFNEAFYSGKLDKFDYTQEQYLSVIRSVSEQINGKEKTSDFVEYIAKFCDEESTNPYNGEKIDIKEYDSGLKIFCVFPRYTRKNTIFSNGGEGY